jgi:hypothetical protein
LQYVELPTGGGGLTNSPFVGVCQTRHRPPQRGEVAVEGCARGRARALPFVQLWPRLLQRPQRNGEGFEANGYQTPLWHVLHLLMRTRRLGPHIRHARGRRRRQRLAVAAHRQDRVPRRQEGHDPGEQV